MLLCERFQQRFGTPTADGRPQEIMLKSAVAQLGVSRRRLYDIINVLEAVEVRAVGTARCAQFSAGRFEQEVFSTMS